MRLRRILRGSLGRRGQSATTWLVPFLAATLVLSLWLGYQSVDAMRSQRHAAESALREYARMAAWQYARHARENLGDFLDEVFEEVPRRMPRSSRRRAPGPHLVRMEMEDALRGARCACPSLADPYGYFGVDLRDGSVTTIPYSMDAAAVRRIEQTLLPSARTRTGERIRLVTAPAGAVLAEPVVIAYFVSRDSVGAPHSAFGFVATARGFGDLFERWYRGAELLPPAIADELPNDSLLYLAVRGPQGAELFQSGIAYSPNLVADDSIGARYGSLTVSVAVHPDAAARIIIGGLPRSKLPLTLALLVLTLGVGGAALFQIRRERQLARLRDDFISGVSHELRTPLAQIRMFAELEETGMLRTPEERRRATRIINREAQRLTHLVENVLRFSGLRRAPPGDAVLREHVDVASAIDEVVVGFQPLSRQRNTTLRTEVEPGVATTAQRGAVNQIVVNLLDNAMKYGPAGQTVKVSAYRRDGNVALVVEDEGPGIPARDRRRIWEPYRRLERDVDAKRPGTGIGLAVVAELAALHGGRAWVEDASGGGARFVVELPAAEEATSGTSPEEAVEPAALSKAHA